MAAIVAALARFLMKWRDAVIVGLAFASGHFHGREKRDYETSVQMQPPHLEGYYLWDWSWDQATDFWPTALLCLCAITIRSIEVSRSSSVYKSSSRTIPSKRSTLASLNLIADLVG